MASNVTRSIRSQKSASSKQNSVQISLSSRLLFPGYPPSQPLPPILASTNVPPALNAEIYHFLALSLRGFVLPWWSRISRYDKEFLPEITRIVTVVARNLETRIIAIDWAALLLCDAPALLTQHCKDYREASSKVSTSYAIGGSLTLPQLLSQSQAHVGVTSDGRIDDLYIRQIVDHVLHECLPPEDYAPEAERYIIQEIFVKVLCEDILLKVAQPWFLHKTILDLLPQSADLQHERADHGVSRSAFSLHAFVVLLFSAMQTISGACLTILHTYRIGVVTVKAANEAAQSPTESLHAPEALSEASLSALKSDSSSGVISDLSIAISTPEPREALYSQALLALLVELLRTSERFAASALINTAALVLAFSRVLVDRLLTYFVNQALTPDRLLTLIRIATNVMFPAGYPGPPPIIPTLAEQAEIRAALIHRLALLAHIHEHKGLWAWLSALVLGPDAQTRLKTVEGIIEPLSDERCNTILLLVLLDCIVLATFPELESGLKSS